MNFTNCGWCRTAFAGSCGQAPSHGGQITKKLTHGWKIRSLSSKTLSSDPYCDQIFRAVQHIVSLSLVFVVRSRKMQFPGRRWLTQSDFVIRLKVPPLRLLLSMVNSYSRKCVSLHFGWFIATSRTAWRVHKAVRNICGESFETFLWALKVGVLSYSDSNVGASLSTLFCTSCLWRLRVVCGRHDLLCWCQPFTERRNWQGIRGRFRMRYHCTEYFLWRRMGSWGKVHSFHCRFWKL